MKTHIYANLINHNIYCHCFGNICHTTTIQSFHILESSLGEAFLPNGDGDSSRQPKDQKLNDRSPINNENLNSLIMTLRLHWILYRKANYLNYKSHSNMIVPCKMTVNKPKTRIIRLETHYGKPSIGYCYCIFLWRID